MPTFDWQRHSNIVTSEMCLVVCSFLKFIFADKVGHIIPSFRFSATATVILGTFPEKPCWLYPLNRGGLSIMAADPRHFPSYTWRFLNLHRANRFHRRCVMKDWHSPAGMDR